MEKVRIVRKTRKYSEDFKKNIVKEFENGKYSVLQLGKLYNIHIQTIYNWIYKYSKLNEKGVRIVEMKDSSTKKLQEQEQKIKELERMIGQKQIKIDYLEKMIDLAKQEFDIDIKKNSNTPPSNGSKKGKKK